MERAECLNMICLESTALTYNIYPKPKEEIDPEKTFSYDLLLFLCHIYTRFLGL